MGTGSRSQHQPNQLTPAGQPAQNSDASEPDAGNQPDPAGERVLVGAGTTQSGQSGRRILPGDTYVDRLAHEQRPGEQLVSEQARARTTVTEQLTAEQARSLELQEQARLDQPEPEVSYLQDFAAFQADYDAARARRANGEDLVPYLTSNATAGLGDRYVGRGFGVELEFDFDTHAATDRVALGRIAADLHEAGLTRQTGGAEQYHAAARRGYSDDPAGWSLERDASVAGELVSPILYDEPATWRNLQTACAIIRQHGGRPTVRTGSHVHVSLHDYDHSIANHNQLLAMISGYQDTLYRLASNPQRRHHRGMLFCWPNTNPGAGYRNLAEAREVNRGHSIGVNLGAVHGDQRDHIEYRMFDGSLHPGTIQTQIKLALGLTHAAFRTTGTDHPIPAREPIGTHAGSNPDQRRLTGQAWHDTTHSYRSLIDTLYTRATDKAQATALFANTRWPTRR